MKRHILLFAIIMIIVFAIAACGTETKPPANTTGKTEETPVITLGTTGANDTEAISGITTTATPVTTPADTAEPDPTVTTPVVTTDTEGQTTTVPVTTNHAAQVTIPVLDIVLTPPEVTSFTYLAIAPVWADDEYNVIKTFTKEDIYRGNLLLINKDYPVQNEQDLSKNYMKEIFGLRVKKDGNSVFWLADSKVKADTDVIDALNEMFAAYYDEAASSFKRLTVYTAYRSSDEQQAKYDKLFATYAEDTDKYVPKGGHSDYQAGLSLFFKYTADGLTYEMNTAEAKPALEWLKANAHKYGFIFRYPADKADITGIVDESAQYQLRYVGKAHSYFMHEFNLCLEEYISYLKNFKYGEKHLLIYYIGTEFETFYVESTGDVTEIDIALDAVYEVSGNNADGYFITIYRDLSVKE